ncbi:UDP-N-acetylmuramoyl-L-alanyl-D-glutamate--2,6-diaminopimelate ligase [Curtobacterium sp. MCPF17_047]|uniref:Mur ligase family protein n=1 Tax=Curtobacterium sp. MCPF17_047 TaxID=2175654 RepID=UPI000DA7FD1C|nr:UDP-N-acetylmuramoyl-L-alanyl-D-glutamate--2,6-diaminopimelate ligase [Curtobacterium sp. MCPF17_047]PZF64882.1 UDP-N-acetylmuramoyl-L-alanyl-D-glutamate--2,6-diaminopimelate ligase [Curtobacterium sp. MCPF17_047]
MLVDPTTAVPTAVEPDEEDPVSHAFDPVRPQPIRLADVAAAAGARPLPSVFADVHVTGAAVATEDLRPGWLFVAVPGRLGHGVRHVGAARASGAVAVLTDEAGAREATRSGLPTVVVHDPRAVLGVVARTVSGTADLGFPVLGVTGTNGKTSTVSVLDALMRRLGWTTAMTSTAERRIADQVVASRLTTPEATELHAFLARARERSVDGAAIEVSAQGLSRHRVDGVHFDVAGFTNLSHDHLDDYADMDEYLRAKLRLFQPDRATRGVVSLDSAAGRAVVAEAGIPVETITSEPRTVADWHVTVLDQHADGTRFRIDGPDVSMTTEVPLLGRHMAANVGLAVAMLRAAGIPAADLVAAAGGSLDVVVPGRMADASSPTGPRVFVDFAHTPDAFAKSLEAIRAFATGPVGIVLGADGDRDPSKREAMGTVAASLAEVVVVADHHPRFEDPDGIRAAILRGAHGVRGATRVVELPDPAQAIRHALAAVGDDGVVYWAGPGLTDYRDVRGVHVPYSSFRDAQAALAEAGHPAREAVSAC